MKILVIKSLIFSLLIIVTYITLIWFCVEKVDVIDKNSYMYAINDKYNALSSLKSPKIVLVGGSNLAFGIDSERIANSIGLPVINTSLHANIGLKLMEDSVYQFIHSGDIIIVVPEYGQFYQSYWGKSELMQAINAKKDLVYHVNSCRQLANIIKYGCILIAEAINQKLLNGIPFNLPQNVIPTQNGSANIYTRSAFNEYGDVVSHLHVPRYKKYTLNAKGCRFSEIDTAAIDDLREFQEKVATRDAKYMVAYPGIEESYFCREYAERLDSLLKKSHINLISSPFDYVYNEKYFFDTEYHLNAEGRAMRTATLISQIRIALSSDKVGADNPAKQ